MDKEIMSLIHKALKKAEGSREDPVIEPPVETFIGGKGGIKSQFTPRTYLLLVLAILSLCFVIYKNFFNKKAAVPIQQAFQSVATPAEPQPAPAVALSELSLDELLADGKKLFKAEKFDEALVRFLEASNLNPNDAAAFNNIGLIYKKKNDFAQAEAFYKKALLANPVYAECLNNMGVLKAAEGDVLAASVYLKKAISASSTYADAYFNLAVLNDEEGNYRDAITNYKVFLQYTDTEDETLISKIKDRIERLSE